MQRLSTSSLILILLPCIALAAPVPDTGQTKCYNDTQEITCPQPGQPFYGQDAQYITNLHSYTKLDANGNALPDNAPWPWAMVRDNVTGLIWEVKQNKDEIQNYANLHDADNTYTWSESLGDGTGTYDFINQINAAWFGGYNNWRLPTIKELSSLVDSSKSSGPTINSDYFPDTRSFFYWSSTPTADIPDAAWSVRFINGTIYSVWTGEAFYVMAVRGEPSYNNFIDNFDGTITDTSTGLMWQKDNGPENQNWQQALSYCENLTLAGHNDWRLPNRNELQTLVDYSQSEPSIDITFFPNTVSVLYYNTSTTYAFLPDRLWIVYFQYGEILNPEGSKSSINYLRCVRGAALIDSDADGISEGTDNCPYSYNPFQFDCDNDGTGDICDPNTLDTDGDGVDAACDNCPTTSNSNQSDTFPPQGNGIGDACDCEGNFNCTADQDVDGSDAATFKASFGRSAVKNPCSNVPVCNGNFDCDLDVDGTDAAKFKSDFGRSGVKNPCPTCSGDPWCEY